MKACGVQESLFLSWTGSHDSYIIVMSHEQAAMPKEKISAENFCQHHFVGRMFEDRALQRTLEKSFPFVRLCGSGDLRRWLCARNLCKIFSRVGLVDDNTL